MRKLAPLNLSLERLEDRCIPSVFIWVGIGADNNWSTKENWHLGLATLNGSKDFPQTPFDTAMFGPGTFKNSTVVLDSNAVGSTFLFGPNPDLGLGVLQMRGTPVTVNLNAKVLRVTEKIES